MKTRKSSSQPQETATQHADRVRHERELIVEAEAEAAAGLLIPQAEANAWMDSLGAGRPVPRPRPRRGRAGDVVVLRVFGPGQMR